MNVWDSAVSALTAQGLIDSSKVGIIGFSRKGWYVEFILAHAKTHYRAATATDNVDYSLGEYWLYHEARLITADDAVYGGPPYGATLKNWIDYSVSFNLDKFHTPLLMEEMGGLEPGVYNDRAPPLNLAAHYEVFTGLNRLNKPVEMYFYPYEEHQMDHPQARFSSMQRNVDWYRFWLEGEEDPGSAKADQYARWHQLRQLQEQDENNYGPRN